MKMKMKTGMSALVAGSASLLAQPALAAGGEAGLPQLDIATWPSQLFWLVVTFGVGYIIMARVVTPRIGAVLEERRARLTDDLDKAKEASEEAAKMRADYEAGLEKARSDAADFARDAAAEATKSAEAAEAKVAKKLATKAASAETKLSAARAEAMENLNAVAAEAAIEAVAQLTGMKATKAQADKTVKAMAKAMTQEAN
jgi:F-type H+-transporting ATPase subunit b